MIYKVPCPTRTNGIRLFKEGNQIAVEYTRGESHVTMAYDSVLGKSAHTVAFREPPLHPDTQRIVADAQRKLRHVYGRDDMPNGTGISRSEGKMAPRGSANINDQDPDDDEDDDNSQAVVGKAMAFLKDLISEEDLERVAAILGGGDEEDADDARKHAADRRRQASDRGLVGRQERQAALDADFDRLFPTARLLKLR
jgi:hypothetical protein